jgi:hypothetical protein
MNLSDLRNKARKGIKAPKRKRRRRDTPITPIVTIKPSDVMNTIMSNAPKSDDVAKAMDALSRVGRLSQEQLDKFVQLMFDPSVIKNKEKRK